MPFTFDLTMTPAGWNACEAAMTAQLGRNPPTHAVSYLYGQEAATGRWVRIQRTESVDITDRWHGRGVGGGHRGSFNQTNYVLPHPLPNTTNYNRYLHWCCFFWQLTRLSGQIGVTIGSIPVGVHDKFIAGTAAHAARFGPGGAFPNCETPRNALPTTYFAPVFKIVVFEGAERTANADLPRAIEKLESDCHVDVQAACAQRLLHHPAGDPLPA